MADSGGHRVQAGGGDQGHWFSLGVRPIKEGQVFFLETWSFWLFLELHYVDLAGLELTETPPAECWD